MRAFHQLVLIQAPGQLSLLQTVVLPPRTDQWARARIGSARHDISTDGGQQLLDLGSTALPTVPSDATSCRVIGTQTCPVRLRKSEITPLLEAPREQRYSNVVWLVR